MARLVGSLELRERQVDAVVAYRTVEGPETCPRTSGPSYASVVQVIVFTAARRSAALSRLAPGPGPPRARPAGVACCVGSPPRPRLATPLRLVLACAAVGTAHALAGLVRTASPRACRLRVAEPARTDPARGGARVPVERARRPCRRSSISTGRPCRRWIPAHRLRRTRRTPALRALVRETRLHPAMLVAPLFVRPGHDRRSRSRRCRASTACRRTRPSIDARTARRRWGWRASSCSASRRRRTRWGPARGIEDGVVQETRPARCATPTPDLVVMADTCLCEYTDHGHCGPLLARRPRRQRRHAPAPGRGGGLARARRAPTWSRPPT